MCMNTPQRGHCIRVDMQLMTLDSWWKNGENGSNETDPRVESTVFAESRPVVGEAMLKWSHNSTLYCTLSHFLLPNWVPRPAQRPLHASQGSVNHTYWAFTHIFTCIRILCNPLQRGLCVTAILNLPVYGLLHSVINHAVYTHMLYSSLAARMPLHYSLYHSHYYAYN